MLIATAAVYRSSAADTVGTTGRGRRNRRFCQSKCCDESHGELLIVIVAATSSPNRPAAAGWRRVRSVPRVRVAEAAVARDHRKSLFALHHPKIPRPKAPPAILGTPRIDPHGGAWLRARRERNRRGRQRREDTDRAHTSLLRVAADVRYSAYISVSDQVGT